MSALTTRPRSDWRTLLATVASNTLPRRSDYDGLRRSWRRDALAGVTVAIVALPLALGFGVTSGVGAAAGMVTAVVAGLVAALLGGSNLQVSGPTGAMTVVLVPIVARYGPESVATVAIMAGCLVLLAGAVGLGRLVAYIPWPVVEGFTMGIGVIIIAQQVPLALDTPKAPGENALLVAVRTLGQVDWSGAWIALSVVGLVVALMLVLPRVRRTLPASLIAVVAATVLAEMAHLGTARIGALPSSLPAPGLPSLTPEATSALVSAALAVAALAALESLLAARVADGMADDLPRTDPNRELAGQGLANIAAGLFGGLPATGAIARTAVNVRAGARTRMAAATHAVVLAAVVFLAAPLVSRIPLAALAGVLLVTAWRMVDLPTARAICRSGRSGAMVFLLTLGTTIVFDLVVAVELGVALAALLALRAMARASGLHREELDLAEVGVESEQALLREHIAVYRIDGALFFADVRRFLDELAQVTDVRVVILRLSAIKVLDTSGANVARAPGSSSRQHRPDVRPGDDGSMTPEALTWSPVLTRPDLLALVTLARVRTWVRDVPTVASQVLVSPIDPELADTAALTAAYDLPLDASANCVVVAGRRAGEERVAAAVVLASTRADVNNAIKRLLDVRKASFLPVDRAVEESDMEYGGITPIGVPDSWRVLVDVRVARSGPVVVGSGLRRSKVSLPGTLLARMPGAEVVDLAL